MYGESENDVITPFVPHEKCVPFLKDERRSLWGVAARFAGGVPASSGAIFRLNELLSQSPTDLNAVVKILSSDLSLSAKVVSAANHEAGNSSGALYRLHECAVLLGLSRLRSLVLTTAVAPADFETVTMLHALCQHSHLTSRFGVRIAKACGHSEPYKAEIAGLLHDLGQLPLHLATGRGEEDCEADTVEHCLVGGWLAKSWGLPAFLVDVIEHHHVPDKAPRDPFLTLITATADQAARAYGVGLQIEPAARFSSDCMGVIDHYLRFLPEQRRRALADELQSEFLAWVKTPVSFEAATGAMEGNFGLWQSAL